MSEELRIGDMEMLPHSDPICLDCDEAADELHRRFQECPPSLSLPIIWCDEMTLSDGSISKASDGCGGPPVDDPLMLYLSLPLSEDDLPVYFKCSLEEVIDDMVDSLISPNTRTVVDSGAQEICRRVGARLRELAEHLERTAGLQC